MGVFFNSEDESLAERERYHYELGIEYELLRNDPAYPLWVEYTREEDCVLQ